jgi:hypothetical protein
MHSIGPSELVLMSIIYLYYNARMYGGGLKEMPCFRTHIKLVPISHPLLYARIPGNRLKVRHYFFPFLNSPSQETT